MGVRAEQLIDKYLSEGRVKILQGKSKTKTEYSNEFLQKLVQRILSKMPGGNKVKDVTVKFVRRTYDHGEASHRGKTKHEIDVVSRSHTTPESLARMLAHELQHAVQSANGWSELISDKPPISKWKGVEYRWDDVKHGDRPWEKDAIAAEKFGVDALASLKREGVDPLRPSVRKAKDWIKSQQKGWESKKISDMSPDQVKYYLAMNAADYSASDMSDEGFLNWKKSGKLK